MLTQAAQASGKPVALSPKRTSRRKERKKKTPAIQTTTNESRHKEVRCIAGIAQLGEQQTEVLEVACSIHAPGMSFLRFSLPQRRPRLLARRFSVFREILFVAATSFAPGVRGDMMRMLEFLVYLWTRLHILGIRVSGQSVGAVPV